MTLSKTLQSHHKFKNGLVALKLQSQPDQQARSKLIAYIHVFHSQAYFLSSKRNLNIPGSNCNETYENPRKK